MFFAMAPIFFFLLFLLFFTYPYSIFAHKPHIFSRISVVGVVYCDACSTNSFSKHSYFLPGVEVNIQCKFKASAPRTAEQISFTVNRTTDKYGAYKLEIPEVDGVDCVDGAGIESLCQATLMKSSYSACDVAGIKTTTDQISVKSKQDNHCIYSLNALSYIPAKKNESLCKNGNGEELQNSLNSSKFFIPYFPPYGLLWPPVPYLQPPSLPFPFPPLPPYLFQPPPSSLPFPLPPLPPYLFQPPSPPGFGLGDPRTWIPHFPPLALPPPPPPAPAFNLGDPRTWIPYHPVSPPHWPQQKENP